MELRPRAEGPVFDVQTGDSVLVQGVNYFSTNATVELRGRAPLAEQKCRPSSAAIRTRRYQKSLMAKRF